MKGTKGTSVRFLLLFAGAILFIFMLMQPLQIHHFAGNIPVLFPSGLIAFEERNLLLIIQGLMLLIVVPVYILTFVFSWKYRAQNKEANYDPHFDDHRVAEYIWWGVPCVFILIIGTLTYYGTYQLDPFKPLESDVKPIKIQAVALQWKWLFIYPEEKIATVNYVRFPEKTPLNFEITADAPMNSLWIPQLGGQIYAMPNMKTKLHLIADEVGEYRGSSANISGEGFAGMHFIAQATSNEDFLKWVETARKSDHALAFKEYTELAKPSKNDPPSVFQLKDDDLFDQILMKFMHPQS